MSALYACGYCDQRYQGSIDRCVDCGGELTRVVVEEVGR